MDITTLGVGKAGVTDDFIIELKRQLKKNKRVRVRFLRSSRKDVGRKEIAESIASKVSGAKVEDVRGNTIILAKA